MLVYSRKKNESIIIGDNILVTVIEIRGDKVRLGIELPKEIPIHRKEVYDAIRNMSSEPAPAALPPVLPQSHYSSPPPDQLDRFASALQTRLEVTVRREQVAQALRDAHVELVETQATSASR